MRDFVPGQRVDVELARGGQSYQVTVDLVPSGDFVIPLLNLFVVGEEWVLWTPSGYYDASPGGDRLIGWHANRGRDKAARYYTAHQFRKQFFRPDVIDKILETGDATRAAELASRDRPRPSPPLDLRKPEDFRRVEPPKVTVQEPSSGARTPGLSVRVKAEVVSQNGLPIGEVKILLNGRPIAGKDLPALPGDTETVRHVDQNVDLEPGQNAISVLATDRSSRSSSRPQEIVIHRDASDEEDRRKPRAFVLAVGVSEYANPGFNLEFAHIDAQSFAEVWKSQAGKLYEDVQTRLLINEKATVAAIREGFDWLNTSAMRRDFAVIFFAAHGVGDSSVGYYIATHDVDPKRLISTAIPDRDLVSLVESLQVATDARVPGHLPCRRHRRCAEESSRQSARADLRRSRRRHVRRVQAPGVEPGACRLGPRGVHKGAPGDFRRPVEGSATSRRSALDGRARVPTRPARRGPHRR